MKPGTDVVALVLGLVAVTLGGLGLWAAFGTVTWSAVAVAAPLCLVVFGLLGLVASRGRS